MTNDYKTDQAKPPVHEAVLSVFPLALMALARMMAASVERHKLAGAADPYREWQQLPAALRRVLNAKGRHSLHKATDLDDDGETHLLHELFNCLAAVELQEQDKQATCCAAPDARPMPAMPPSRDVTEHGAPLHVPAGADWRERPHCPLHPEATLARNPDGEYLCMHVACDWRAPPPLGQCLAPSGHGGACQLPLGHRGSHNSGLRHWSK